MSYTAHGAADTEYQFEEAVEDNKIFSLDGYGDKYDEERRVGEQHAKGEQDTEGGSRGSHGNKLVEQHRGLVPAQLGYRSVDGRMQFEIPGQLLYQTGSYTGGEVVEDEPFATPHRLECTAEHEDREHVEEDVVEAVRVVKEHVGDQLNDVEIVGFDVVQSQQIIQVDAGNFGQGQRSQPHNEVDDDKIERDGRYRSQKRSVLHK